jgi:hypothetical protein
MDVRQLRPSKFSRADIEVSEAARRSRVSFPPDTLRSAYQSRLNETHADVPESLTQGALEQVLR